MSTLAAYTIWELTMIQMIHILAHDAVKQQIEELAPFED